MTKAAAASSAIAGEVLERRSPVWIEKDSCPDAMEKSAENPEENPAERARQEVLNRLKLEMHEGSDRNATAAKDDRAKAPTYLWDRWTLPYCNVIRQRRYDIWTGDEVSRCCDWRCCAFGSDRCYEGSLGTRGTRVGHRLWLIMFLKLLETVSRE